MKVPAVVGGSGGHGRHETRVSGVVWRRAMDVTVLACDHAGSLTCNAVVASITVTAL